MPYGARTVSRIQHYLTASRRAIVSEDGALYRGFLHRGLASCSRGVHSYRRESQKTGLIWNTTARHVYRSHEYRHSTSNAPASIAAAKAGGDGFGGVGAPEPPLAVVFTDIVKSTAIWECAPKAMLEAMHIHDALFRKLAGTYSGYEVKQNGDGFMFVFQDAVSALNFCLAGQLELQEQAWSQTLLDMEPAKEIIEGSNGTKKHRSDDTGSEVVLWRGLRLRMSIHYGKPICKWNEVIQRMDYLGPAVNRAARFVSAAEGGQIVVSDEYLQELKRARIVGQEGPLFGNAHPETSEKVDFDLQESQDDFVQEGLADFRFEVHLLGERPFKGVVGKQKLFYIIPKTLVGRLDCFPQHKHVQAEKGNIAD